jgi:hypothetical protein
MMQKLRKTLKTARERKKKACSVRVTELSGKSVIGSVPAEIIVDPPSWRKLYSFCLCISLKIKSSKWGKGWRGAVWPDQRCAEAQLKRASDVDLPAVWIVLYWQATLQLGRRGALL